MLLVAGEGRDWEPPAVVPPEAIRGLGSLIVQRADALMPATEHEIAVVLGRLAMHFWHPDRPEEHYRLVFEDWILDLAEYPIIVLDQVAAEWRRTQRWGPKIAEMRELCDRIVAQRRTELLRLQFLAHCAENHGGRCPRLLRRIGDRLVDYDDPVSTYVLEAALNGRTEFPGDRVLAFPGTAVAPPPPDPAIAEHRRQVFAILADGFSAGERLAIGDDITVEAAEALAAERINERARQLQRQRVLQTLLAGGLSIREIEAGQLLDVGEDEARRVVEERRARAAAIAAAAATETSDEVH